MLTNAKTQTQQWMWELEMEKGLLASEDNKIIQTDSKECWNISQYKKSLYVGIVT